MKNTKTTKRALLSSVLALFLCVAMLTGTTFAWFTDTVSSGVNTIVAGNLDIELEYSKTADANDWHTVQGTDQLFKDVTLWEPGATSVVYLRLTNQGSLDLKYRFSMAINDETSGTNVEGNTFYLSNYIQFSFVEGQSTKFASREEARAAAGTGTVLSAQNAEGRAHDEVGTMKAGAATRYFALVVFMPETVGNEANYKKGTTPPEIELGLNLVATQLASENDSFDNQYDGGANVGGDYMNTASAVVTAPAVGQPMEIVLNNNAPASQENSTALTMASVSDALAGKEVEFTSTAMNVSAAQQNFAVATGNNIEVAALKLELKVDDVTTSDLGGTATITTYIQTGLTNVGVKYVGEGTQPTNVQYDPATGKLSFDTTHFSDYVVTAQALSKKDGVYEINNATDLFAFARLVNVNGNSFSGKTVKLMADIDLAGQTWTPVGQTGATQFQGIFEGNGKTIKNMTVNNPSEHQYVSSGFFGWIEDHGQGIKVQNVKFENASVTGSHYVGVVSGYVYGTVSGCEVKNSTVVGINMNDDANGDKIGGIVGYVGEDAFINNNKVINCSISGNRDIGGIVGAVATGVDSFTGNSVSDTTIYYATEKSYASAGEIVSGRTGFVPDANTNTATNVKVIKMLTTQEEFDSALAASDNVEIVLAAGNFQLKNQAAMNKTVVIKGTKDSVINLNIETDNKLNYQNGATLTFEGVTLQGQTSGNYGGLAHVVKTTFNNCTINGKVTLYGDAVFTNCTFNNDNDYSIWTWGAKNATFVGCTFNSGGKAILLYGGAGSNDAPTTVLTVTDCVFNDNDTLNTVKAAIEIGNDYNAVYNLTVNNATVNGFAAGKNTGSKLWANKDSMDAAHLNVVIDGADVY